MSTCKKGFEIPYLLGLRNEGLFESTWWVCLNSLNCLNWVVWSWFGNLQAFPTVCDHEQKNSTTTWGFSAKKTSREGCFVRVTSQERLDCTLLEFNMELLLMAEILHHLGCMKPYKKLDKLPKNWCRISSIISNINTPLKIRGNFCPSKTEMNPNLGLNHHCNIGILESYRGQIWRKFLSNGGDCKGIPLLFQGNLGWWNIIIWPQ